MHTLLSLHATAERAGACRCPLIFRVVSQVAQCAKVRMCSCSACLNVSLTMVLVFRTNLSQYRRRCLQVKWWRGSTASGSSGSPLIDMDTQQVVGVLTGGYASCLEPNEPDYYGRLSAVRPGPPTPLRALHARACCIMWSYPSLEDRTHEVHSAWECRHASEKACSGVQQFRAGLRGCRQAGRQADQDNTKCTITHRCPCFQLVIQA